MYESIYLIVTYLSTYFLPVYVYITLFIDKYICIFTYVSLGLDVYLSKFLLVCQAASLLFLEFIPFVCEYTNTCLVRLCGVCMCTFLMYCVFLF